MSPLERDALPGALLDPLIARLKVMHPVSFDMRMQLIAALEKCREALLMDAPPEPRND